MKHLKIFENYDEELKGIFTNWTKMTPHQFEEFKTNWLEEDPERGVSQADSSSEEYPIWWGSIGDAEEGEWKWNSEDYKLYSDMSDSEVYKIMKKR